MNQKSEASFLLPQNLRVIICLGLALIALLVFWPAKDFGFINYDDPGYFSENPHVLGGFSAANFKWALTSGDAANWHPLTWLSLMFDAQIFGPGAAGPHLVNILFHAANTVLLFIFLQRITGKIWRSALVAILFAMHPMHVESVAWISERKDLLSLFFELLAMLAYVRGLDAPNSKPRRIFSASLLFFALALMSKPMAVTMPFLLLLLDFWPLNRVGDLAAVKRLLLEKIPFFALAIAVSIITFLVQRAGGAVASLNEFSFGSRMGNALISYVRYLEKLFWPVSLATPYPHPAHWPLTLIFSAALLLLLVSIFVWRMRRVRPYLVTGWCWFLGTLVPVIGIVQVGQQAMADRYSYLPFIGIFFALVWFTADFAEQWHLPKKLLGAAAVLLLLVCGLRTQSQLQLWQNDGTLFSHAIAVTGTNFIAEINLGAWLSKNGDIDQALAHYTRALQIEPTNTTALYDTANIFLRIGDWSKAEDYYRQVLVSQPKHILAANNLVLTLIRQKKYAEADTNIEVALRLQSDFSDTYNNLGLLRFHQNRLDESARAFARAMELAPENPVFAMNAADAFARIGQNQVAAGDYEHVLELQPDNEKARAKLAALMNSPMLPAPK